LSIIVSRKERDMRTKKYLTLVVAALTLVGCVSSSGRRINHQKVSQIQKGVSTRADVERLLGKPDSIVTTRGMTMLSYTHMVTDVTRSVIPVVGLLAGGGNVKSNSVMVTIGSDGKVMDVTEGASEHTINTGLLNADR
jgi:outer membrane protein assembly factor BamE (lipoprotein component of BamABCDE complex)